MLTKDSIRVSYRLALMTGVLTIASFSTAVRAAPPIDTNQPFYLQSQVGLTVLPNFQGGTLRDDQNGVTDTNAYAVGSFPTNTIDAFGNKTTFSGVFSGTGPLNITDSVGGGAVIVTNASTIGGTVTINSGAMLQWGNGTGVPGYLVGGSGGVVNNGTLALNFGGGGLGGTNPISGSGNLLMMSGAFTEGGISTYTGATTINSGAILLLQGTGSIATSSGVANNGTFDISLTTSGASITSLSGSGTVSLGAQTLTLSNAGGTFSGVLADGGIGGGTGGSVTISGGTEIVTGVSNIGGTVTIDGGATLQWGNGAIGYLIGGSGGVVNNGTLTLNFGGSGLGGSNPISGSGNLLMMSGAFTEGGISTYTGATTINSGAILLLQGTGSIASSSGVANNGTFDISLTTSGASITSLSGSGTVSLGAQTLTLSNASGTFSGVLADGGIGGGTGGSVTISGGTEIVTGVSNIGGTVTIDGGATLQWGNGAIGYLIGGSGGVVNNGTLTLNFGGSGLGGSNPISGSGNLLMMSGAFTEGGISTYTGATTINSGAILLLQGTGSIATSSGVANNGTFDISMTTSGASIMSLSGSGTVSLGAQTLTLSNAGGTFSG